MDQLPMRKVSRSRLFMTPRGVCARWSRTRTAIPARYAIANKALIAIADQLQGYATSISGGAPHKVEAGVYTFSHNSGAPVVNFGPLDANAIRTWAKGFSAPAGNTPLGNAVNVAAQRLLASSLPHKHVLVITDGANNEYLDILQKLSLACIIIPFRSVMVTMLASSIANL